MAQFEEHSFAALPEPIDNDQDRLAAHSEGGSLSSMQEGVFGDDEQEADLSIDPNTATNLGTLKLYKQRISKIPVLRGKVEAISLAKRIERGDLAAKERLIEANLRLAYKWANLEKYQNRGLDLVDLVQASTLGLIRAVEKYDWRYNQEFSTYAVPWLNHEIERTLADTSRMVRLPDAQYKKHRKVVAIYRRFSQEKHLSPDLVRKKISEATGLKVEEVLEILGTWFDQQPDSLDRPLDEDSKGDEITLGHYIPVYDKSPQQDSFAFTVPELELAINSLPEPNRSTFVVSFNIESAELSASAIATVRSLHPDTVRKRNKTSLEILRNNERLRLIAGIDPLELAEESKAA